MPSDPEQAPTPTEADYETARRMRIGTSIGDVEILDRALAALPAEQPAAPAKGTD